MIAFFITMTLLMNYLRNCLITIIFLAVSIYSSGQYYNNGKDRGTIKWQQIRSVNFNVIFPEGFEAQGERVAKLLEKSYEYTSVSLGHKPKKVSVVLHTESSISNASLGWAPSRIDMYTVPPQDCYSQDWFEQLAIHEFRHMVQLSKLESEMPKLLRFIFGEQAAALLTGLYLPFWFIEGDAVSAETGLGNSGRGRVPDFHKTIKAQLIEKGKYKYDKASLGSYKDNVANHYEFGYLLVSGARKRYNDFFWDDVVSNVAKKPFSLNPFGRGIKRKAGIGKVALYDTIFNGLRKEWIEEDKVKVTTPQVIISPENFYYTDYKYCARLEDGNIYTLKSGLSEVTSIVSILDDGNDRKILTPGYIFDRSFTAKENLIVWCEYKNDIRWSHAVKSALVVYDIINDRSRYYKLKNNVFAPSISNDNKKIVAVEVDDKYRFSLVIIDIESGEELKRINTPDFDLFITPSWGEKDETIVSVLLEKNVKKIVVIDSYSGKINEVESFKKEEVTSPKERGNYIYFIGSFTGTDNLYALKKTDKKIYKVINSRFGIFDYSFDQEAILYNDYSSDGYRVVKTDNELLSLEPFDLETNKDPFPLAENLSKQEGGAIDFQSLDNVDYRIEKYFKPAHLFNFHSWAPVSIDPESQSFYPGVSVMGQNMLGTAETTLGYKYKWDDDKGEFYAKYKYFGWFPVIETEVNYGKSKTSYRLIDPRYNQNMQLVGSDTIVIPFTFNETNWNLSTYVPLNFSKGNKYRMIYPFLNYRLSNYQKDDKAPKSFPDGIFHSLEARIYLYNVIYSSQQDLLPDFGFFLDIRYSKSLPGVVDFGSAFSISNRLQLPGVLKTHGIQVYNAFQRKFKGDYSFSDNIRFPRGHNSEINNYMYLGSIDYMMPLFYPDLPIGGLAYIKRIKMTMFYDHAYLEASKVVNGVKTNYTSNIQSAGIELKTDVNLLRLTFPFEIGFRTSYLFNKKVNFDFLFNVNFSL